MDGAKQLEKLLNRMKKFLIIGAGAMGSAFSMPCTENRNKVTIVGTHLENKLINKLQNNYFHPFLKSHLPKRVEINNFNSLGSLLNDNPDYVVVAVSSKGIDWVCGQLVKNYKKKYSIVLLTKGLLREKKKIITIPEKINSIFRSRGLPKQDISSVKGPCLASGLINRIRTSTVIANLNTNNAKKLSKLISTDYYKTEITKDVNGVEALGAIKNIYAMLIGASIGLSGYNIINKIKYKYYHNTSSSLFKNALLEMKLFSKKMNGFPDTAFGLAGLGDLYVSVAGGRNSKMGYYLGKGKIYSKIKKNEMKNITIEGCDLAKEIGPIILKKFKKQNFPIMFALITSILKDKKLYIKS